MSVRDKKFEIKCKECGSKKISIFNIYGTNGVFLQCDKCGNMWNNTMEYEKQR